MATATRTAAKKAVAPAKAAVKKPTKAAPAAKKVPAGAKAGEKSSAAAKRGNSRVPPERRRNYVEVAAYFIAERHGFTPGRELNDWAEAEAEIDRLLEEGLLNP